MVQSAKLAVVLVALVLIQCTHVDGWWHRRRRFRRPRITPTKFSCRVRRSIYEISGKPGTHNGYGCRGETGALIYCIGLSFKF